MNPIIQSLFDRKSCRIFKDKERLNRYIGDLLI